MRIVIDLQGAQTESRFRGIGRYSLSFSHAIARNRGNHEVFIVLNGLFPDTIDPIKHSFTGLLPDRNIVVWHAPGPVHEISRDNTWRRETAEIIREAFIARLQPDIVHVTSLFEGYVDDAVTSVRSFDTSTQVSVSLYDLIPLLNRAHYLDSNPTYAAYYLNKLDHLKQATIALAISQYSCDEAMTHLESAPLDIVNISTAIEEKFKPIEISSHKKSALFEKWGVNKNFVFYTGGADSRKNLSRLLQAYSKLPAHLRQRHQLVLAGKISDAEVAKLQQEARNANFDSDELVFTGYVSDDELIALYNLCELFVFPSWHEGFGLPALEAMSCGAPTLAANTSSLPEVVALEEALFDPFDTPSITSSIASVLNDADFRNRLREHGLNQAQRFSWDQTARTAIAAFERHHLKPDSPCVSTAHKPRLAVITPLPPLRTGIADYNAILIPALSTYYEIHLVIDQSKTDDFLERDLIAGIHSVDTFRRNADSFDRVLYHLGNSPYHQHMMDLIQEFPGVVVQHDFYLSSLVSWMDSHLGMSGFWLGSLYLSHGYPAVRDSVRRDINATKLLYPANFQPLRYAEGILVHSDYSRQLMQQWYGQRVAQQCQLVPMVRKLASITNKRTCREALKLPEHAFIVCSFGFVDPTKLNHKLIEAWNHSKLGDDRNCRLIFVGENHGGEYGRDLRKAILNSTHRDNIEITGYIESARFALYLGAADMAVQLRTDSRGETSAAVYDCLNHGLPLIVNANGSMAEVDQEAALIIADDFVQARLIEALETLFSDPHMRSKMGVRAAEIVHARHSPEACARRYYEAIEHFHLQPANSRRLVINAITRLKSSPASDGDLLELAQAMALHLPPLQPARRLLLDITATCKNDLKTGIERVVRALATALINNPPDGFRVEPVYLSKTDNGWCYRHACRFTLALLECPTDILSDTVVDPINGDLLLGLDLSGDMLIEAAESGLFTLYRHSGVKCFFMVYDLLPVRMPHCFPPGADQAHHRWLKAICAMNGAIAISKHVADDLLAWRSENDLHGSYPVAWFHLGGDVMNSVPTRGVPPDAPQILEKLRKTPTFLMVGTVEPRKGHLQALEAFSQLWEQGIPVNLVIIGKMGWAALPDSMRRTIPDVANCVRKHPQLGKHLFWLEGISDEFLEQLYAAASCLLAASEGEGFGLPLIEAARWRLPILARDIEVFREVAGNYAAYFQGTSAKDLANATYKWLEQHQSGQHIHSEGMPWLTWHESAANFKRILADLSVE